MRAMIVILAMSILATGLATGCNSSAYGTGTRSGEYSIPPRPAGATYPNWEHLCIASVTEGTFDKTLRQAGAEGWELIGLGGGVMCFKRPAHPLPDAAAQPPSGAAPGQPAPEPAPATPAAPQAD